MSSPEGVKDNKFQCGNCLGVFDRMEDETWSTEKALAEAAYWFEKPVDQWVDKPIEVCDVCYKKMDPLENPKELAESIENEKKLSSRPKN